MAETDRCPAITSDGEKASTVMYEGTVITVLVCDRPATDNGMCEHHQPGARW